MFIKAFTDHKGHIARIAEVADDRYFMIVQNTEHKAVITTAEYLCMTSAKAALEKISSGWVEVPVMYINLVSADDKPICQCSACGKTLRVEHTPNDYEDLVDIVNGLYNFCPHCGNIYAGSKVDGIVLADCDTETKQKWEKYRIGNMADFVPRV